MVLAMAALMFGCGAPAAKGSASSASAATTTQSEAGTHKVVDHAGNTVEVPNKINRIAVCDILPLPSVLSIFFDSAEKIVGMAEPSMTAAKNSLLSKLYPEILKADTGFIKGTTVNTEELLKLKPDVVFYSASSPDLGEQLKSAGFAAVAISVNKWNYNSIETLNHWIELLSEIFPDNDKTEIVAKKSSEIYDMVQKRVSGIADKDRARAFFLFKYSESSITTSGKQFFGQWWADAIGAKNVASELTKDNSVEVSMEQIYKWNPNLIFVTNFTEAQPDDIYKSTIGNYDWSNIDAVKSKRVYKMPLGMYRSYTPGADTPITLLWLAKTAYPDLFKDIDVTKEAKDYYKTVFGISLTDEQIQSIFTPVSGAAAGF